MSSRLGATRERWIQLERDQRASSASEQQRHLASTLVAHLRTVQDTPRPIAVDALEPLASFLKTDLPTLYDPTYPHSSHALEATVTILNHVLVVELPLLWDRQARQQDPRGGPAFVSGREGEGCAWLQVMVDSISGIFTYLDNNNELDERGSVVKDQPHRGMVAQAVLKDIVLLLFSEDTWRLPGFVKYPALDLIAETLSKHGPNKQYLRSLVSIPEFTRILDDGSDYFIASSILEAAYRLIPNKSEKSTTTKSAYCEILLPDAVFGPSAPESRKRLCAATGESYFDLARQILKAIGQAKNTRHQGFETLETYYTHNEEQLSGIDDQSTDWWICRDMVATEVDEQNAGGQSGCRFVLAFEYVDRVQVVKSADDTVTTFFMSRPATISNAPLHGPKGEEGNKVIFRTAASSYDAIIRTLIDRAALYPQLRPVGLASPTKPRKSSQAGPITKSISPAQASPPPSSRKNAQNERRARELAVIAEVDRSNSDSDSSIEVIDEVSEVKSTMGNIEESLDDIVTGVKVDKGKGKELTTAQLSSSSRVSILLVANTPDQPEDVPSAASTELSEISDAESLSSHSVVAAKVDPLPFNFRVATTTKDAKAGPRAVESKQVEKKTASKAKAVAPPAPRIPAAKPTKSRGAQLTKDTAPIVPVSPRKTRSGAPFSVSPSGPPPPHAPKPRPTTAKRPLANSSSDSDVDDDPVVPERKRAKRVKVVEEDAPPKGSVTQEMDETTAEEESAGPGRTASLAPYKKVAPLKQKYGKEKPRRSTLTRAEMREQAKGKQLERHSSDETDYSDEEQVSIVRTRAKASSKRDKKRDDASQIIEDSQPTLQTSMDSKGKGKEREKEKETRESMKGDKSNELQVVGKKAGTKGGTRASAASTSKAGPSSTSLRRAQVQDDSDPADDAIAAAASVAKSWTRGHPSQKKMGSVAELVAPTRQTVQQVSPRAANPFQPNPKPVTFRVEVESETSKLLRRVSADSHAGQSTFSPMLDPAQDETFVDRAVAGVEDDEPSSFFDQTLPRDTLRFDSGPTRDKVLSHESSASDDEDHLEEQSDERVGVDAPEIAAEDDIVLEDARRSPTPEFIRDSEHDQDVEMIAVDALILVKVAPVKAAKAAASRPRVVESKSRARITAMDVDVREPVDDSGIFFEDDVVAARDSLIDAGSPQGVSSSPSLPRSIAAAKKPTTDSARSQPIAKHLAPSPIVPLRRSKSAVEKVAATELLPSKKPRIIVVKPTQVIPPPKKAKPVSASSNGLASSSQRRKSRLLVPAPRRRSPSVRSEGGRSTSRGKSAERDAGVARRSTSRGDATREAEVEDVDMEDEEEEEEEEEEGDYDEMQEMRENLDEMTSIILAKHAEKSAQTARQFQDSVSFLNHKAVKYLGPIQEQSTRIVEQTEAVANDVFSKMDAALAAMEAFKKYTASVMARVSGKKS